MDISELELVQITIILLMMTFILAVITCLLSHYWLPALAFLSRLHLTQRDQAAQMVMCGHLDNRVHSFMQQQQQQHGRSYPQRDAVNLPPIICLLHGEEPLAHAGPCGLHVRPPEPQLELRRQTVRGPPNKTVYDATPTEIHVHDSNSVTTPFNARMEGSPPPYTEITLGRPHSTSCCCQYSSNVPSADNESGVARLAEATHVGSSDLRGPTRVSADSRQLMCKNTEI